MLFFCCLVSFLFVQVHSQSGSIDKQSIIVLSNLGLEYLPKDEQALLLYEANVASITACAQMCQFNTYCRILNFDYQSKRCRIYEGDTSSTGTIVASSSPQAVTGLVQLTVQQFINWDDPCSFCEGSRYLTCIASACQCPSHTFFNGSFCQSQQLIGAGCTHDIQCRNDLNLICSSNLQCASTNTTVTLQVTTATTALQRTIVTTTMQRTTATTALQRTVATTPLQRTTATTALQHTTATTALQHTTATTALQHTTATTEIPLVDLTRIGDRVVGLYNTTAGRSTGGSNGIFTGPTEDPRQAFDNDTSTKYFNNGIVDCSGCTGNQTARGPGYFITPSISSTTIASALLFATANDYPERDPITVTLEGSNATTNATLHLGSSWTLIYSGPTGISSAFVQNRSIYMVQQNFSNTKVFASYRLLVTSERSPSVAVQYSEARILGKVVGPSLIFLTRASDSIVGVYNTTAGKSTGGFNGKYSNITERPSSAIDRNTTSKYLNFGSTGCGGCSVNQPGIGTGFFITPSISTTTVAHGVLFATAADFPDRDPITITLEGSNATTNATLHLGSSWTLIYNGSTGMSCTSDPGRSEYVTLQSFSNTKVFASYRLLITSQCGDTDAVQYSEAHILGYS